MIHSLSAGSYGDTLSLADLAPAEHLTGALAAFSFRVVSWSMYPTLLKGDEVEIAPADNIRLGDIVVFCQEGWLICHRITSVGPGHQLRTRGDQTGGEGERVHRKDMIGKVTAISRGGRRIDPGHEASPALASLWRMRVDEWWSRASERSVGGLLWALDLVARQAPVRHLFQVVAGRIVQFSLGFPAPIRTVRAYQFVDLGRLPFTTGSFTRIPEACRRERTLVLRAHLGGIALGTLDLDSGEAQIRRAAAGLGLEDVFARAAGQLRAWLGWQSDSDGPYPASTSAQRCTSSSSSSWNSSPSI